MTPGARPGPLPAYSAWCRLVPPVTALFAGLVFGGRLGPAAIPGMAVAAPGAAPAWRS